MKEINPAPRKRINRAIKISIAIFIGLFTLTIAYFIGLFALLIAAFWLIWGFIVAISLAIWGWLVAFFAGTWLVGLIATLTGWITTFFIWFSGTWLGSIFVPIYQLIFPLFAKVAPFFSVGSSSAKLMKWFKKFRNRGQKDIKSAVKKITKK